jgi:hypothetical protein
MGAAEAGIVAEYQRLLALEEDRRRRRDKLEALLPAIADALDIRVVFPRMTSLIQDVIPHVTVALALLTPDRGGVKIHAASNYDVGDLPEYRFTTPGEAIQSSWRSFITYDCNVLEEGGPSGAHVSAGRRARVRRSPSWSCVDAHRDCARSALGASRPGSHQRRTDWRDLFWIGSSLCI